MDSQKVGQLIFDLRKKNNLTQQQLAEKLCVTSQAVSKWENGRGVPDIDSLRKISKEFNIDISAILDGEVVSKKKYRKKINFFIFCIICLILGILLGLIIYFNVKEGDSFRFSSLISDNSLFEIKGVAAYSSDKKSIYISHIDYLNNDDKGKEYVVMECALYEKNNNVEKVISQCGKIDSNKIYEAKDAKSLKELLSNIEFHVDNYTSTCKELVADNLYLMINVLNIDNKIVTYKVPLKFNNDSCDDSK